MKNKIFRGIILVAIIVWAACMVIIMGALYSQYSTQYMMELKNEAYIVSSAVEEGGIEYLDQLQLQENHRITWVDSDGVVLYDSEVDAAKLGNHKDRPEIAEAYEEGYGEDSRYSQTVAEKNMYSAVRLTDGSVLRVSQTQFTIFTLVLSMLQPILVVLLLAIVVSLILAARISKHIVKPINDIDLENPKRAKVYDEVKPLVDKIYEQNEALNKQISKLQIDVDEKTREANFRKEFTANVSHELKTPLTSISGFAEIIKNGIVKEEDIAPFAGKIYDEAQRLIILVGDIIKLSQLDEKQVAARKENIDLYGMAKYVIETLQPATLENNIKVNLEGEHLYVDAVAQILEEMIYNLCDNAIKYNVKDGNVSVNVEKIEGRPAIKVSDTGIGIPQEDVDRVFERFYRVNKSHSKEIGGTGLGLSIVKHAAAYHEAEIRIESKIGKGTAITIIF